MKLAIAFLALVAGAAPAMGCSNSELAHLMRQAAHWDHAARVLAENTPFPTPVRIEQYPSVTAHIADLRANDAAERLSKCLLLEPWAYWRG